MALAAQDLLPDNIAPCSPQLFGRIAGDLREKGYSINPCALPPGLADGLLQHLHTMSAQQFAPAAIGREQDQVINGFVRKDNICWITGESAAGCQWLEWTHKLQVFLNRELFLGLFSFESHFAHYPPGGFYRRHLDAFRGESNRILSVVAYLNPCWQADDGGELVLYPEPDCPRGITVAPALGTLAVFLSEEVEHEVLATRRDRFSVAGWFRVNSSTAERADPPT